MKELLNGGWKAYMFTKEGEYGSAQERYFNVELKASKKSFKAQANWAYIYDTNTGESIEEKGSDMFKGKFDNSKGRATVKSDFAMIEFDAFYISKDYSTEYGLGTVSWISGEKERIGIMRRRKVRR